MKSILLKSTVALFSLLILIGMNSCKKENFADLTGQWSNVRKAGTFLDILTQLELKSNGDAKETVMNITSFSTNVVSERDLTWKVENENILVLKESGQPDERFTFSLEDESLKLVLTSISDGTVSEFFKEE